MVSVCNSTESEYSSTTRSDSAQTQPQGALVNVMTTRLNARARGCFGGAGEEKQNFCSLLIFTVPGCAAVNALLAAFASARSEPSSISPSSELIVGGKNRALVYLCEKLKWAKEQRMVHATSFVELNYYLPKAEVCVY